MKSDGGRGGGRDSGLDVEEAEADWELEVVVIILYGRMWMQSERR